MNAFYESQFNCCPFIWMCHSPQNHNKINRLHKRCLRIVYNDKRLSFNALLEKDGSVSIYERNIKILATEMFKVSKNLAPPQMHEIFKLKDQLQYNLRYNFLFLGPLLSQSIKVLKVHCFILSITGYYIYYRILTKICLVSTVLKKWRLANCPCRSGKVYIVNVGFV